jgi:hypothetical protein
MSEKDKDKESLSEIVNRGLEVVEEYTGVNGKKFTAKTATGAYMEVVKATAITAQLLLGEPTALAQQEPVKRPDEHIASQSHPLEAVLEASNTIEDDLVSAVPFHAFDTAQVRTKTRAQVMLDTSPQPLPLIAEVKEDKTQGSENA